MKEKVLALLTQKFAGVRKDTLTQLARLLALQAKDEDAAKALVDGFTQEQIDEFNKDFRADIDREVSESTRTFEQNLKKKFDLIEKKTEPAGTQGTQGTQNAAIEVTGAGHGHGDIAQAIAAAVAAAIEPIRTDLSAIKAGNVQKSRLQQLTEKLDTCNDVVFKEQVLKDFGRMKFDADEDFTEYLKEKTDAIAAVNQNAANSSFRGGRVNFATGKGDEISDTVKQYIETRKAEQSAGKSLT